MPDRLKILVITPAWIGDAVMTHSLIKRLRLDYPNAVIDVFVASWCQSVFERMPEVNQILVSPFKHGCLRLLERIKVGRSLRQAHYDWAIITKNSWKSAVIPYFANIKRRIGWLGEGRYGLLNDIRHLDKKKYPLMVERLVALGIEHKDLVEKLDWRRPTLQIDHSTACATANNLNLSIEDKPIMAFCPGAEFGPAKRWPTRYFAEVAMHLVEQGWQVWLFGGPGDSVIAAEVMAQSQQQCIDLTGKTTLAQAIDLMSLVEMVLTNDTGLMHIAAALDKPLIALYGSSSPAFTPPLTKHAQVLSLKEPCSPCFKRTCPLEHFKCMNHLNPLTILKYWRKMLENPGTVDGQGDILDKLVQAQ